MSPGTIASEAPDWPHCDRTGARGPCPGRRVESYPACLAHLGATERAAYLDGLEPGADLDHRGTPFTQDLLDELLTALRDPGTGRSRLGRVDFDEARFSGDAQFQHLDVTGVASFGAARFEGGACFDTVRFEAAVRFGEARVAHDLWFEDVEIHAGAWFHRAGVGGALRFSVREVGGDAVFEGLAVGGDAVFSGTEFGGIARFAAATVGGAAWFDGAVFRRDARFDQAEIARAAWFDRAEFRQEACFDAATMREDVSFHGARFARGVMFVGAIIGGDAGFGAADVGGDVVFRRAAFQRTKRLGPVVFPAALDLSGAVFESAVTIEAAVRELRCRGTRWASTASLRLRYAAVDLSDAVLEFPVGVASRSRPFLSEDGAEISEEGLTDPRVRLTSLRGVDAAHLVLTDVDLTCCLFAESVHLDQLKLEGRCPLPLPPPGVRWTRRRTLVEEHHWRAARRGADGWTPAPDGADVREPAALAPVYRQLRKALEDGRNEPGAADFYYGEMEMRRHDPDASRGERTLLHLYWAVSGYGLRATRALGWLLLAVTATVLAMMLWGLPRNAPEPVSTGKTTGGTVTLTTRTPDPVNPSGPYGRRLSSERFEKALRVVVNSVVFRSSGQELTVAGTYVDMASCVVEPALLGLAALAVRSRVKR
ncbi:pentapeptide repeat-containing protein [Streptomyces sp. NPDC006997]|uniref:pentapeptide repeat-containing protein n=1 Tax=Streptomyces sp. NPDC006997 TaxID=3155356 RepID=UPI0033F42099